MKLKRILCLCLLLCVILCLPTAVMADTAWEDSGNLETDKPSKQEIVDMWRRVTTATEVFTTEPSVTAPYAAGELCDNFLESGITYLNYVRFVANLPAVQLDDTLNEDAQHGAVVLAAIDMLTHYPSCPSDMDEEFYSRGAAATASSNISARWGYSSTSGLQTAVSGCMADSSSLSNLSSVGHRRWLLNPTLLNVGFGYAESQTGASYIVTKVFDWSGEDFDYDFISWPASGYFPTNLFATTTPWSVSLNPQKYQKPNAKYVQITVTRVSDGKTWKFDRNTGEPQNTQNAYMVVENSGYGVSNCIIFHPGSANIDAYDGLFNVTVTGISDTKGNPVTLSYQVDFFNVNEEHRHTYNREVVTEPDCTNQGYTTYYCECGASRKDNFIPAVGHKYDSGRVTTDPGCETTGVKTYTCGECGATKTDSVAALGHEFNDAVAVYNEETRNHSIHCTRCKLDVTRNCEFREEVIEAATPEKLGVVEYTCVICGGSYRESCVYRLAGANRWETSLKVADEMKANLGLEKFDSIIIASGNDFADALAGSYLSTVKNAPILLGWGKGGKYVTLDEANIAYIKANLAEGGTVYILGGKNAVPELYETELKGYNVKRLGGANRFETNLLILEEAGVAEGAEILVCTSTNFADSLSASATAKPVLLVFNEYGKLYGKQPEFLAKLQNCTFTVIGGESAVSADLAKAIEAYGKVERLAGSNRFETSVLVAQKYFASPETAVLAYAWNYPDGLCGGSLAFSLKAPLILTMTKYEAKAVEYAKNAGIEIGLVLGGDTLISDEAVRAIFAVD